MKLAANIPKTMKAAVATDYGDFHQVLSVKTDTPVPRLADELVFENPIHSLVQSQTRKDRKTHMIIRTLAVALAPGDCRVMSGATRSFQGPPSFPYIPGGDCCGIVVETSDEESYFEVGDIVAARFTVAPRDGMGEYARVSASVCEKVQGVNDKSKEPPISPVDAAALASASPAVCFSEHVRPNDRILVLGAGGGIGAHFCQLARAKGASYICGVSRTPTRLLEDPIGCDDAIDYTKEDVFASSKYRDQPFDCIFDMASGGWPKLVASVKNNPASENVGRSIVKTANQGGRFITMVPDKPTFEGRGIFHLIFLFTIKPLIRTIWSRLFTRWSLPTYSNVFGLPDTRDIMTKTLALAKEGTLKAVIDGPHPLTTEGVREAFAHQKSRHPQGKVVVEVAKLSDVRQ